MRKIGAAITCGGVSIAMLLSTSCSNDDKKTTGPVQPPAAKTHQEMLVGKWKNAFEGKDANANGIWDADEREVGEDGLYAIFKNDGTYEVWTKSDTSIVQYQLLDSTKLVYILAGERPDTAIIDKLTETTLIIRDYDGPTLFSFQELKKVN